MTDYLQNGTLVTFRCAQNVERLGIIKTSYEDGPKMRTIYWIRTPFDGLQEHEVMGSEIIEVIMSKYEKRELRSTLEKLDKI